MIDGCSLCLCSFRERQQKVRHGKPGSEEIVEKKAKAPKENKTYGGRESFLQEEKEKAGNQTAKDTAEVAAFYPPLPGAAQILDFIGKVSGIDEDVYGSCDAAMARKILSLARYFLLSEKASFSHLETWQLLNPMEPYGDFLSRFFAHRLLEHLNGKKSIAQTVFQNRALSLGEEEFLVFESAAMSTYEKFLGDLKTNTGVSQTDLRPTNCSPFIRRKAVSRSAVKSSREMWLTRPPWRKY